MNIYEKLLNQAASDDVCVDESFELIADNGLYIDGNIALSDKLETNREKACVLAEELGHHYTSVGNIIDMKDAYNRKQERQARLWSYNRMIGLRGITNAFEAGCQNRHEMAEYLEVTEEFLQDCIDCYRDKYGVGHAVDNHYIMFIPTLMVGKII